MRRFLAVLVAGILAGCGATPVRPQARVDDAWTGVPAGCPELCERLVSCRQGPFDLADECLLACDGAEDDPVTAGAWSCRFEARDCEGLADCDGGDER